MGERESSVANLESNLENDPSYLVAQEVAHRLTPIDNMFSEGKIDRDVYFTKIDSLKDKLLEQNEGYSEDQSIIGLVCDSSLIIRSACQRFSREMKKSRENLALVEASWQIGLAEYFLEYESQPATIPVVNLCLDRFNKTLKELHFDGEYAEGVVRGVKGLLATMNALKMNGHQIELPTSKQDAEGKVDLISVDEEGRRYFWQIKTVVVDRKPSVIGIDRKQVDDPDNQEFVDLANTLLSSAQKAEAEDDLTTKAVYITIPEPQIGGKFGPRQSITNSIKEYLSTGDRYE